LRRRLLLLLLSGLLCAQLVQVARGTKIVSSVSVLPAKAGCGMRICCASSLRPIQLLLLLPLQA
jgi:hypothetical protein